MAVVFRAAPCAAAIFPKHPHVEGGVTVKLEVQGATLKMTATARGPALARMERAERAWLAAPRIPQASLVPLWEATLLAAAAVGLHAIVPAWRVVAGLPAVAPW